ncbi:tRNA(Ile)-lysidine synthase TilS/MesJ [Caloramator fervidus]|uniref:tRNA(Ile)-lysidine synthase TilS/MesJ n=1 Tax=Caloramator fervidus TaxID=29344 RepID=A0A1H5RLN8_9CLOT|nr:ATP-binding protein [Caloramator fervidus]SEF39255.1 tRNA(Ile)-lysidine synthase TilS/MesJ [Caloramator fervidus]
MQRILGRLRKCIQEFNMIKDKDKIAVGLSGGKDSTLLLYALALYKRFSPQKFELGAITIDMGFYDTDLTPLIEFTKNIEIPYKIVKTDIAKIVFDIKKEKNPCSLCAKLRRGALYNTAKELGYNKVALAHHLDDLVETFLLSLFFEGRIHTFSPVTYFEDKDMYVIRPFIYTYEKEIRSAIKKNNIPVIENPCPANKKTQRQKMKDLIKQLQREIPDVKDNLFRAIYNEKLK